MSFSDSHFSTTANNVIPIVIGVSVSIAAITIYICVAIVLVTIACIVQGRSRRVGGITTGRAGEPTTHTATLQEEEEIPANRSPEQEEENSSTEVKAAAKD